MLHKVIKRHSHRWRNQGGTRGTCPPLHDSPSIDLYCGRHVTHPLCPPSHSHLPPPLIAIAIQPIDIPNKLKSYYFIFMHRQMQWIWDVQYHTDKSLKHHAYLWPYSWYFAPLSSMVLLRCLFHLVSQQLPLWERQP